ncbi:MAG: hypothetical protein NT068_03480 [Candidatus Nomurabacteria bacterium]|nr:hypothetical protein [Candidatus Nomurabacteria bacterium]
MNKPVSGFNLDAMLQEGLKKDKHIVLPLNLNYKEISEGIRQFNIGDEKRLFALNKSIITKTKDLVLAYRMNLALYLEHGDDGINAYEKTIDYIKEVAPNVPVLSVMDLAGSDIKEGISIQQIIKDDLKNECKTFVINAPDEIVFIQKVEDFALVIRKKLEKLNDKIMETKKQVLGSMIS